MTSLASVIALGSPSLQAGFLRTVGIAFPLLGLIFGLMQPVGSMTLGRFGAVLFWVLHGVTAVPCILGAVWVMNRSPVRHSPRWFVFGSGLLAALALSPLALALEFLFGVQDNGPGVFSGPPPIALLGLWLDEFAGLAPPFVLAWILLNLPPLMQLGSSIETSRAAPVLEIPALEKPEPITRPTAEGLLALLPPALGTDVILLSADLHYLKVHTPRGRTMLLYNLALAETEFGDAGVRVHRSHWVADRHVLGIRRRGSAVVCQLTGGLEVPVSRRRQAEVIARYGRDSRYRAADT